MIFPRYTINEFNIPTLNDQVQVHKSPTKKNTIFASKPAPGNSRHGSFSQRMAQDHLGRQESQFGFALVRGVSGGKPRVCFGGKSTIDR